MSLDNLWKIVSLFGMLSILSIGGGNTVVPEMHRQAVSYGWLDGKQFADLFAIAQAAPGPSVLLVSLVGYKAGGEGLGGIIGALLATIAMVAPAGLLVYFTARFWTAAKEAPWRRAIEVGFAPLTVGLVLASGVIVAKSADHGYREWALTAVATIIFTATKINPLIVVGIAGVIGWLGWLGPVPM
ncbi:chromate transporter [Labrys miyagiensis]|uniref:Chromate transporter n=1 Tax=Labrys miyagiensis TaxID=346912 RepID=A0ABQ6CCA4_9HYPH|nr:chromate transporter [Labrys miyagiensis]GLS18011.1 chromate transporter [Labrys miyagiensis]